jgi:branched-chain amino acid transport system permease protein
MEYWLLNLANGISYGALLFVLSTSFSLIAGITGVTNLAHGAIYMLGAYIGWSVVVANGFNFLIGIVIAGAITSIIGFVMERFFLRHFQKQLNEQILLTYGFLLVITNVVIWIWGATFRAPYTASFLSGSVTIKGISYPTVRISIIVVAVLFGIGLWLFQDKTRAGAIIRAGMDDKEMIEGLGINISLANSLMFIFCTFIAGATGVIGAQVLGAGTLLSFSILILALVVTVVGGIGSIQGALLGGMIVGVIDSFGKALFHEFAMFTVYVIMIIVLLIKPTGILGRRP